MIYDCEFSESYRLGYVPLNFMLENIRGLLLIVLTWPYFSVILVSFVEIGSLSFFIASTSSRRQSPLCPSIKKGIMFGKRNLKVPNSSK